MSTWQESEGCAKLAMLVHWCVCCQDSDGWHRHADSKTAALSLATQREPETSVLLQTFMQPVGATAPSMAPHAGAMSSNGRGIEGAGIGLDTDQVITRDHSSTSQTNPYLDTSRKGLGSPAPVTVTPGGEG